MTKDSSVISRRTLLVSSLAGVASCRRQRGGGWNGYAFVANEEGRAVAAVDLTAFAVAKHIRLEGAPTEVIAHREKPVVWALTPASGMLYEIDGSTLSVRRKLFLGGPVTLMKQEPGGRCLWVLSAPGRRLLRVPVDEFRVSATTSLPIEPVHLDLSNHTGLAAIGYGAASAVSLVALDSGRLLKTAHMKGEIGTVRFRSDGRALLVANKEARQLTVLDAKDCATVVHLPLSIRPDHFCFHPDGGQLFITGEGRDVVVVVYPYFVPEVAETVLAGSQPGVMAATSRHLFVTNPQAGDLTILNISRRRLIAVTAVGAGPGFVTVTPDGEYALVLNEKSGDMAVIRVAGLQPDRRRSAALFTMIPVGSKPVSAVVTGV